MVETSSFPLMAFFSVLVDRCFVLYHIKCKAKTSQSEDTRAHYKCRGDLGNLVGSA